MEILIGYFLINLGIVLSQDKIIKDDSIILALFGLPIVLFTFLD